MTLSAKTLALSAAFATVISSGCSHTIATIQPGDLTLDCPTLERQTAQLETDLADVRFARRYQRAKGLVDKWGLYTSPATNHVELEMMGRTANSFMDRLDRLHTLAEEKGCGLKRPAPELMARYEVTDYAATSRRKDQ